MVYTVVRRQVVIPSTPEKFSGLRGETFLPFEQAYRFRRMGVQDYTPTERPAVRSVGTEVFLPYSL